LTSAELKRWLEKQGCTFGTQKGSHLKVYLGDRQTVIPMHDKKEMKKGTVQGIRKALGLK
jgi:mRNA interferase HicA